VMEDEHGTLVEREAAKCLLQLLPVGDLLDVIHAADRLDQELVDVGRPAPVARRVGVAGADEDSEGPTLKVFGVPETWKFPPDGQQGILKDILGEAGITDDPPGDAQECVADLTHQIRERVLIAGAGSLHQLLIQPTLHSAVCDHCLPMMRAGVTEIVQ